MTINRLNQGTTNQVLVKAISGQTTNLLELQDSSGNVVSSIGPTGALGGTLGDSGLVHIETQNFTSFTGVTFSDNIFTSEFDTYLFTGYVTSTSNPYVLLRLRAGGSDNSTSNYNYQYIAASGTSLSGARATSQTSARVVFIDTNTYSGFSMKLFNPKNSTVTSYTTENIGAFSNSYYENYIGIFNATTSFDSATLFASTSTITGSFSVYGYRK